MITLAKDNRFDSIARVENLHFGLEAAKKLAHPDLHSDLDIIAQACTRVFGSSDPTNSFQLVGVMIFGSSLSGTPTPPDIDVMCVLVKGKGYHYPQPDFFMSQIETEMAKIGKPKFKVDLVTYDISICWSPPHPLYVKLASQSELQTSLEALGRYFNSNRRGDIFSQQQKVLLLAPGYTTEEILLRGEGLPRIVR